MSLSHKNNVHNKSQVVNCRVCNKIIMVLYSISSNTEEKNWLCLYTAAIISVYKSHLLTHTSHQIHPEENAPLFLKPEVNWALWSRIITVRGDRTQLLPLSYNCRANFLSPQRFLLPTARADVKAPPPIFLAIWVVWPSAAHPTQTQHVREGLWCYTCVPCGTGRVNL